MARLVHRLTGQINIIGDAQTFLAAVPDALDWEVFDSALAQVALPVAPDAIGTAQLAALDTAQLAALASNQIEALSPADLALLSTTQLAALTPQQQTAAGQDRNLAARLAAAFQTGA